MTLPGDGLLGAVKHKVLLAKEYIRAVYFFD